MSEYGIREGYTARAHPAYFADTQPDFKVWQPDVLPIAAHIARRTGAKRLIDIGCGRGTKLEPYANEFEIIGVDYGANIEYCRQNYKWGQWIEYDLERGLPLFDMFRVQESVLICSDVIEHLNNPLGAIFNPISHAKTHAKAFLLSTPDRLRTYGYDQSGPPGNPHHVREWTLDELNHLVLRNGGKPQWKGWTRSNNVDAYKNTQLLIFSHLPLHMEGFDLEQSE